MSIRIALTEVLFSELLKQVWIHIVRSSCRTLTCIWNFGIERSLIFPNCHSRLAVVLAVNSASKLHTPNALPISPSPLLYISWDNSFLCTFQDAPARMLNLWYELKISTMKILFQTILNIPLHLPGFRGNQSQLLKSKKKNG